MVIYPNFQAFLESYTHYDKYELSKEARMDSIIPQYSILILQRHDFFIPINCIEMSVQ
jgi:hypothetical protein